MAPIVLNYIAVIATGILCILVLIGFAILITNTRKIRMDMHAIRQNVQPLELAKIYEFLGDKEKAIQCYKETLFNVVFRKYKIPGMKKKLAVDYLESKILSLGGKLPDHDA
jgi:hypothetical protein